MEIKELNLNEMEQVNGGSGGYQRYPKEKRGCFIYRVESGDTLSKLAARFNTSVNAIMAVNPELDNPNFIVARCYIYIPD